MLPVEDKQEIIRNLGNTVEAFNSVPTAIYCFAKKHQRCAGAVLYAVSLGGDTDTIGAMTGAITGAYRGDLPNSWKHKLEKGDYITDLAQKLWNLKGV